MSDALMRQEALKQIEGVGDETWIGPLASTMVIRKGDVAVEFERERLSYQVRRRLSEEEQAVIGDACDLRGTKEATERLNRAMRWLPRFLHDYARSELEAL